MINPNVIYSLNLNLMVLMSYKQMRKFLFIPFIFLHFFVSIFFTIWYFLYLDLKGNDPNDYQNLKFRKNIFFNKKQEKLNAIIIF